MIFGKEDELQDEDIDLKDVYDYFASWAANNSREMKTGTTTLDIISMFDVILQRKANNDAFNLKCLYVSIIAVYYILNNDIKY